ncbi:hypothetical protein KDL29_01565 [bacterium]|nr:hypothetical protein [bacterium]
MLVLDACPLCRTTLKEGAGSCPGCGADLAPWSNIAAITASYIGNARELITEGELEKAEAIISRLSQLSDVDPHELASLQCKLALACQDIGRARELLSRVSPAEQPVLTEQLAELGQREMLARELYNQALTSARRGEYVRGARQMEICVRHFSADPALWELKLKLDLKCAYYMRVYADLRALDRLNARPAAWLNLESMLPPV